MSVSTDRTVLTQVQVRCGCVAVCLTGEFHRGSWRGCRVGTYLARVCLPSRVHRGRVLEYQGMQSSRAPSPKYSTFSRSTCTLLYMSLSIPSFGSAHGSGLRWSWRRCPTPMCHSDPDCPMCSIDHRCALDVLHICIPKSPVLCGIKVMYVSCRLSSSLLYTLCSTKLFQ